MATPQKDIIYIDIDDEITAIIDKVRASEQKIVALVLPKRAAVFQSIVNMKLLKRSAETAKKHIVLITSETGLLPLAGAVGLHVAPTLQSRPMIPPPPEGVVPDGQQVDESDFDPEEAYSQPVGQLAGPAAFARPADELETIELDDDEPAEAPDKDTRSGLGGKTVAGAAAVGAGAAAGLKAKKGKKFSIPDFNKFRLALVLGGVLVVALLVFGYFAAFVLPKATVTLATDSSDITTDATITLDPKATELDIEERTFPAKIETVQQSGSQQVSTSGQKNKGTKASGEVHVVNCSGGEDLVIPAGTGVSANGMTFITQEAVNIPLESNNCKDTALTSDTVKVLAQSPGAQYNIGAQTNFSVAGQGSAVKASSKEAMSGGTDNIVKVVAQSDIDKAKQQITNQDANTVKDDLKGKLESAGYIAIQSSVNTGEAKVTPSASVGDEADTVTVSSATPHTMYGVKKTDLETFVTESIKDKIDPNKQKILDTGINKASFDISSPASSGNLRVGLSTTALAGPDLKIEAFKKQIAGKKTNDVRTIARATPGVTDVSVKYSPFWVSKVPTKEGKITVVIEKSPATTNGND